jgi:molybdopterin-binding protein
MSIGRLSARNSVPGTVTHIKIEPVSAEVTVNIAGDIGIVSVIGTASAEELKLKV